MMKFTVALAIVALISPAIAFAQPAKVGTTPAGTILETPAGKALYVFDGDEAGSQTKSNCDQSCATLWPPFAAAKNAKAEGDWSVVTRQDGTMQWAYKGRPLYTWAKDDQPGQTNGNSFEGNTWHVAKP